MGRIADALREEWPNLPTEARREVLDTALALMGLDVWDADGLAGVQARLVRVMKSSGHGSVLLRVVEGRLRFVGFYVSFDLHNLSPPLLDE